MLIKTHDPGSRWKRDVGISELIIHFDQEDKIGNIEALTSAEVRTVLDEIRRCQEDFIYAARNYFWIKTKQNEDKLFSLWESQELILDELDRIKGKGMAQKLMIVKARQLGASTLIEAKVAHAVMFNANVDALVVSAHAQHTEYLFGIMAHIYDHMPWWLRPMLDRRSYEDGIFFDNPNKNERRTNPGLNSKVMLQSATGQTGVGQGRTITAAHVSEYSEYQQKKAKEMIEGDLKDAIPENNPNAFAILESTARGAGTYAHKLWLKNVALGEEAGWIPKFLPWFFEKTRFIAPEKGWRPDKPELDMREKVQSDWVRCSNIPACGMWYETFFLGESRVGIKCLTCDTGTLTPYALSDPQLRWMSKQRVNAEKDSETVKILKQEMATTAVEAFQISGFCVFPQRAMDFADRCVRNPIAIGHLDNHGRFHGVKRTEKDDFGNIVKSECFREDCALDHRFDEAPLRIWEYPRENARYSIGVDVAEGIGQDYSVAFINRIGEGLNGDVHVGTYRSNTISPYEYATVVNFLGHWYNEALLSIEYNIYQTTADIVRINYNYPNLFRWKNLDSNNVNSHKWHWLTQVSSKSKLWQTAVRWLKAELWVVRSENFAEEMKTFQKDEYDDRGGGAESGFFDDELMAGMIALYTAHDLDWSEDQNYMPLKGTIGIQEAGDYEMKCVRCGFKWKTDNPENELVCRRDTCNCRALTGKNIAVKPGHTLQIDFEQLRSKGVESMEEEAYDRI